MHNETVGMIDVATMGRASGGREGVKMYGMFHLTKMRDGRVTGGAIVKNLVTSAGKAGMASRFGGVGGEAAFTYLAVGEGSTAANVADTTLQTETASAGLSRANATASRTTTSVTNDTASLTYTWTVTGTKTITELGIFNATSSGTMACRTVFTGIAVSNGDQLVGTYTVQFS
jgi:hypothetical protein